MTKIDYEAYLKELSENNISAVQRKAAFKRHASYKERNRAIVDEALTQTYLNLNAPLEIENKQLLVSLLTKGYVKKMNEYESAVIKTLETCFRQIIPNQVLKMWNEYRDLCVPFPGFLYKCGKEYGQEKELFINLDLPMYFRPDICQGIFQENWPEKVSLLEKRIALFHYHRDLKTTTEIKYAKSLITIQTYLQLLERKTNWYGILIEELKRQNKLDLS